MKGLGCQIKLLGGPEPASIKVQAAGFVFSASVSQVCDLGESTASVQVSVPECVKWV